MPSSGHKYPRRFKHASAKNIWLYTEIEAPEELARPWYLTGGKCSDGWPESEADEFVESGKWIELFDHHPPAKEQILYLKHLVRELRNENSRLRERLATA